MRVFKNRAFDSWAKEADLTDDEIREAIREIDDGLVDANLGACVYKKRIASGTKGKRGGYRTLVCYKKGDKAFFVYGFGKGVQANINKKELEALKKLSKYYFSLTATGIAKAIKTGSLIGI